MYWPFYTITNIAYDVGDVMAGVGPFSIPAVKKGAFVYCNDLNPESYKWLLENIKLNKVLLLLSFPSLLIINFFSC